MSDHLTQKVELPIEQGDPLTLEIIASLPDSATPTSAQLVVREDFGNPLALADVAGGIGTPGSPEDGFVDWPILFDLTESDTRSIGAFEPGRPAWRRFAAAVTYDGAERTFAAGRMRCAVRELTTP